MPKLSGNVFIPPALAALPVSTAGGAVARLTTDGELYEDATGGWRRVRTAPSSGSGDMLKSIYDTNLNGIVDNSDALGGTPAQYYPLTLTGAVNTYQSVNYYSLNLDPASNPPALSGTTLYTLLGTNRSGGDGEGDILIGAPGNQASHLRVYRVQANGTTAEKLRLTDTDLLVGTALSKVWHAGNLSPNVRSARTITTSYTVVAADSLIFINAAANITVTLPAVARAGQEYRMKRIDSSANTVTVLPGGTATLEGAASLTLAPFASIDTDYDGTNWWVS